jgi:hypothetical protein
MIMSKLAKKEEKAVKADTKSDTKPKDIRHDYHPHETTIKEMMIMKNVDYDEALHILRNPTPHETGEERSLRLSKSKK